VTLGYRKPPSWRVPVAIVVAVILVAVAATAVALNKISDNADREVGRTPIKVKGGGAAQKPKAGTELVKHGVLYDWPRDLKAFTVVLLSTENRADAEKFARSASDGAAAKIGVIAADDFKSLPKGTYAVFAGRYRDRPTADKAAARLRERFSRTSPQRVAR